VKVCETDCDWLCAAYLIVTHRRPSTRKTGHKEILPALEYNYILLRLLHREISLACYSSDILSSSQTEKHLIRIHLQGQHPCCIEGEGLAFVHSLIPSSSSSSSSSSAAAAAASSSLSDHYGLFPTPTFTPLVSISCFRHPR